MGTRDKVFNHLSSRLRRRFRFLLYPAAALAERDQVWKSELISKAGDRKSKFPLRMMRYWWTLGILQDEANRLGRTITVCDVGCGKGILHKYAGDSVQARWVGLDMKVDRANLTEVGYDELYACDFDQPLPVADSSADVVVFLHVLEHLPRPEFTFSELTRILRPGGVIVAGSPVAPKWIARMRERQFRKQLREGKRRPGAHMFCFWPARWSEMVRSKGLTIELLTGAYLLRWAGNPLENTQWWLRLNQLWGALFPSLGGEVYVMARSSSPAASPDHPGHHLPKPPGS